MLCCFDHCYILAHFETCKFESFPLHVDFAYAGSFLFCVFLHVVICWMKNKTKQKTKRNSIFLGLW